MKLVRTLIFMNNYSLNNTEMKVSSFIGRLIGFGVSFLLAYWFQIDPLKEYG